MDHLGWIKNDEVVPFVSGMSYATAPGGWGVPPDEQAGRQHVAWSWMANTMASHGDWMAVPSHFSQIFRVLKETGIPWLINVDKNGVHRILVIFRCSTMVIYGNALIISNHINGNFRVFVGH